jgi:hypothetical protein
MSYTFDVFFWLKLTYPNICKPSLWVFFVLFEHKSISDAFDVVCLVETKSFNIQQAL